MIRPGTFPRGDHVTIDTPNHVTNERRCTASKKGTIRTKNSTNPMIPVCAAIVQAVELIHDAYPRIVARDRQDRNCLR